MKRFPMMLQLMLIMFFVMAIPITIITWYSETQILQYSENAIAGSTLDGLNANRKLNENALNNLSQNAVRLATTRLLDRIRDFKTWDEVNANYDNLNEALAILKELMNLNNRVEGVYSSYFYLKDSDYVVSTDKGITMVEKYETMDWLNEALSKSSGVSGVWQPRSLSSGRNVISYVLPLSHLSTTTQGTIVVNLLESQVRDYLQNSKSGKHSYLMTESDGTVLSHSDESLFLTDAKQLPFIEDIMQRGIQEGYSIHEIEGERLIYTWHQSSVSKWWNINIYSMDELMSKAHSLQNRIFILTGIFILFGAFLTVFLATWLSKPLRQLVQAVRARSYGHGHSNKNELAFLDAAFKRMQEEEAGLYQLIKESEQDARSLAIYHLLRGEVSKQIEEMFPLSEFRIAVVSIDRYRKYVNNTNPETRKYHRLVLIAKCEGLFPENVHSRCVYHGDGNFVT